MVIGVDIDGVLADFVTAFRKLIKAQTGLDVPHDPVTWNFHRDAGVTKAQDDALWATIKSGGFWSSLPELPKCRFTLSQLYEMERFEGHSVYFITSRPGRWAKQETQTWLERHGHHDPTVIIADKKGPIAQGLELDLFIDDKWENCRDVAAAMVPRPCRVCMVTTTYNNDVKPELLTYYNVETVPSALAALALSQESLGRRNSILSNDGADHERRAA